MKRTGHIQHLLAPWAELIAGMTGGVLAHQFGFESVFDHCGWASPVPLLLVALLGLAIATAGGLLSWDVLRNRDAGAARKVVATVSVGMAALFAFAILLPMIASLMLPPCFG